jgi:hypothetical protein
MRPMRANYRCLSSWDMSVSVAIRRFSLGMAEAKGIEKARGRDLAREEYTLIHPA